MAYNPAGQMAKVTKPDPYKSREAQLKKQIKGLGTKEVQERQLVQTGRDPYTGQPKYDYKTETRVVQDPEIQKQAQQSELSRTQRELDMLRGEQRGQQLFGEGALGRVEQGRSGAMSDILAQRQQQAQEGFGAEAFQKAREARLSGLSRAEQMQQRQLRGAQAGAGVAGGVAMGQQMGLMQQQQQQRQAAERDMFLQNVAQKQQSLGQYEQSLGATEAGELERQKYNQEQKRREIMGRLTAMFGEAGLGVAERSSAASAAAAKEYAAAAGRQGGGKK